MVVPDTAGRSERPESVRMATLVMVGRQLPAMGRVASERADLVFLTSDNPRGEDPEKILADVRVGAQDAAKVREDADRRAAIRAALREARAADVVLIAGKGHETQQVLASGPIEFDDRVVAREEWV